MLTRLQIRHRCTAGWPLAQHTGVQHRTVFSRVCAMHMSMRRAVAAYAGPQQDPAIAMLQGVMAELRSDPVLRKALDSPRVQRALQELRAHPARAMTKYASDSEVMAVVRRLVAVGVQEQQQGGAGPAYAPGFFADLGPAAPPAPSQSSAPGSSSSSSATSSAQRGSSGSTPGSSGNSAADLASQLFSDPKLAAKLAQPKIRLALSEIRSNPAAGMAKWESDPEVCEVLDLLEARMGGGVIDV